ncbi:MAG: hypothetical protein ACREFE_16170, partial [Limisphaerales bacterium]
LSCLHHTTLSANVNVKCYTLWQGPNLQANLFLSLIPQTHGTPVFQMNYLVVWENKSFNPLAIFEAKLLSKKNFTQRASARSQQPLAQISD